MSSKAEIQKVQKKFLAYLFHEKRYIAASLGKVTSEHLPDYYFIYTMLTAYYDKYKGVVTDDVVDIMFAKKNLDANTIIMYKTLIDELRTMLTKGDKFIGNDAEFEALLDELTEYKERGDWYKIAEHIATINPLNCSTDHLRKMEDFVTKAVTTIVSRGSGVREEGSIADAAPVDDEAYEHIKNNPEDFKVIKSGFSQIDEANGGFRPQELIYIIGRKGDGKSVLMVNLAHNAWVTGSNVIIFTLEISAADYRRRFHSRAAGVNSRGIKMGNLEPVEEAIYKQHLANIQRNRNVDGKKTGVFYVVDVPQGCTPAFIESKLESVEQIMGIKFDMVISDYAGIMRPNTAIAEKRHEQGQIALDLKRLAREHDCVVVSAAQMNRSGAKSEEVTTEHLAESDQISDHIDWGLAIRSLSDTMGKIESFKTRDAEPVKFHFTKKYSQMKIIELEDGLAAWDGLGGE